MTMTRRTIFHPHSSFCNTAIHSFINKNNKHSKKTSSTSLSSFEKNTEEKYCKILQANIVKKCKSIGDDVVERFVCNEKVYCNKILRINSPHEASSTFCGEIVCFLIGEI